ncbi:hypothetical protein L7F22_064778 [Adiantum nelumboides]|nr:hypothetical protein [Adiantum nelumboides]
MFKYLLQTLQDIDTPQGNITLKIADAQQWIDKVHTDLEDKAETFTQALVNEAVASYLGYLDNKSDEENDDNEDKDEEHDEDPACTSGYQGPDDDDNDDADLPGTGPSGGASIDPPPPSTSHTDPPASTGTDVDHPHDTGATRGQQDTTALLTYKKRSAPMVPSITKEMAISTDLVPSINKDGSKRICCLYPLFQRMVFGSFLRMTDVLYEIERMVILITTGTLENGLFVLDRYEKQIQACIAETKIQAMQDAELWHARFGHVGYGNLMTLQRHNMVHDLSLLEMPPSHVCEGCVHGKMHKFAFSQDGSIRATRKLQLVHSDVCGPMRTPSVGNSLYFVTFIDDFSRFCWVYPLKAKSNVFAIFQHYVSMVDNETGCKVQTLCTDRRGEYMSGAFKDFLGNKGIKHQCTMPYTPQQNGVAERKNRSLMEMARCMLKAKSLPHKLWMEAAACAAHVLNRCPTRALKTITPYESWYDRKPSVSYLRGFGCLAYAHIPQQLRGKLDDKAVKCIFVGYSSRGKVYRF